MACSRNDEISKFKGNLNYEFVIKDIKDVKRILGLDIVNKHKRVKYSYFIVVT